MGETELVVEETGTMSKVLPINKQIKVMECMYARVKSVMGKAHVCVAGARR